MTSRFAVVRRILKPNLALRLGLALSIAILPLGLISVYQTYKVLEERQILSETALLEQTQQAVAESRDMIRSAVSTAETLAITVSAFDATEETCDAVMARVVEQSPNYTFAGFVDDQLILVCASNGGRRDLGNLDSIRSDLTSRETNIQTRPLEFAGGIATVSVAVPVFEGGQFRGTVWIAVPISVLNEKLATTAPDVDLVLFQSEGEIVATADFTDDRRSVLPASRGLKELAEKGRHTFRDKNRDGNTRDFAVVPIVNDDVLALGSWEPRHKNGVLPGYEGAFALYFPFVMWAIAIGVAYVGVHHLVIRHVRRLRSWMRLYAAGRGDLDGARLDNAPEELEVVAEAFRAMTKRLSEQERHLEEDLREKTVLLREVHHRVKNNLQLISSMLNMQIRSTGSTEARDLLRRVQDRVMALSAIHRYLYMARKLSLVRADRLLDDIIQQLVIVGTLDESGRQIRVTTGFGPVEISPDQSVPLSLLATEAAINAVKYCGMTTGADAWINIALKDVDDDRLCLSVVNSRIPQTEAENGGNAPIGGSGLGSRLIEFFVSQLNGTLEINDLPDRYELHVVFPVTWPAPDEDAD
ncbi:Two-component sensor histidine kinase, contains HisKA and HATPase domains [Roseovarius azorensis]|uniref:histidine kinase n=1 Tax=Roseovarius azorensis TaxID=1287727 RepID=A0A1H7KK95_9RHOB|nr:sensor histidine kinase [Roseovarius azorensis]SEK87208.1 Two-component sensor histidine kinase, contains HisKA and HATPase domains [Roseovarius azorensis]